MNVGVPAISTAPGVLLAFGRGGAAEYVSAFKRALPQVTLFEWPQAPAEVDYAVISCALADVFQQTRVTRAIFTVAAGVDDVMDRPDLPLDVPLFRLEDAGMAPQMAQYVLAAVLRAFRGMEVYRAQQGHKQWARVEVPAATAFGVGVMGLGRLGQAVLEALAPQGFPLAGWSRSPKALHGVHCHAGRAQLPAFLAQCHVLVCLLPLTPDTRDLLDAPALACLPRGAHIVNVARGEIVVDADLLAALDTGQLASATLDVFRTEPLPADHAFWHHPRITVTPHISALTLVQPAVDQIAARITALARGEHVAGAVDRVRGY